ncbi:hypothetical protein SDC9_62750 [bioreactor metagenome]|uniref:Uncharacterized protein n=1 Tax=bioreactor metagenome TaxID=1076179 RepID=A0A644XKJ8_9ZZZZ
MGPNRVSASHIRNAPAIRRRGHIDEADDALEKDERVGMEQVLANNDVAAQSANSAQHRHRFFAPAPTHATGGIDNRYP